MQSPIKNDLNTPFATHSSNAVAVYLNGALGDLLVATAALFELIQCFGPNRSFVLIGSSLWKEILLPSQWPAVTAILACHDKSFQKVTYYCADTTADRWVETPLPYQGLVNFLKPFGTSVNLNPESFRFAYRSFLARNPMRVGIHKQAAAALLFTHFHRIEKGNEQHERDRYLQIMAPLNPTQLRARMDFWQQNGLPPLNSIKKQISNMILINPTASIREKAWPVERFRELAMRLQKHYPNFTIHIVGSPKETEWLQEVAQKEFAIVQPRSIRDLIEVVQGASLLIANTSSMQFISACTQTKTLTIIGAASPKRWGPLGAHAHYVKSTLQKVKSLGSYFKERFNKKDFGKKEEIKFYSAIQVNEVFNQVVRIL